MKLPKLKYWYHSTTHENADKILSCGYLMPQEYKNTGYTAGVFFANSKENAGSFCAMRGISEYIIFKIPRDRFIRARMHDNPADKNSDPNMLTMRYLDKVKVYPSDAIPVVDDRDFNIPGFRIITDGTNKIGYELVDREAFENYIENNPKLKAMIQREIAHKI